MMDNWLSIGDTAGGAVANPVAPWLIAVPSFLVFALATVFFLIQAKRNGRFSFSALLFFSAMSMSWQEFYADWGAKLIYSPRFALIPWTSAYTSPNKPWFVLAAYGWYFLIIYSFLVSSADWLRRRNPGLGLFLPVLVIALPFFYLWDFLVEGGAAATGWWVYTDPLPPVMSMAYGSLPLLHPIGVFTIYGIAMTAILSMRAPDGSPRFEALTGSASTPPGLAREIKRLLTWCLVMNGVYFALLTLPCMLVRIFDVKP